MSMVRDAREERSQHEFFLLIARIRVLILWRAGRAPWRACREGISDLLKARLVDVFDDLDAIFSSLTAAARRVRSALGFLHADILAAVITTASARVRLCQSLC